MTYSGFIKKKIILFYSEFFLDYNKEINFHIYPTTIHYFSSFISNTANKKTAIFRRLHGVYEPSFITIFRKIPRISTRDRNMQALALYQHCLTYSLLKREKNNRDVIDNFTLFRNFHVWQRRIYLRKSFFLV